jgi:uncharacterized protein
VDVDVKDNEHLHRYEALVDGEVAGFVAYRPMHDGVRNLVHTEVDSAFEGKGIASKLVARALEAERARGGKIIASCPFVSAYLRRHPGYADLVA